MFMKAGLRGLIDQNPNQAGISLRLTDISILGL